MSEIIDRAKLIGVAPILVVADVVNSAEYYRDVLGFTILSFFGEPPVYAMVRRDSCEVHFGRADSDDIQTNEAIRKQTCEFVVWVPEIEAFFDEVSSKNAEIAQEIVRRSYGREFLVRDCDGHKILVVG